MEKIFHKLNPYKQMSWCGEQHYSNSQNFVRSWRYCTCAECLKWKYNIETLKIPKVRPDPVPPPEPDIAKLKEYWRKRDEI